VSYVDAGYSIALGVLFLYAISLFVRRRRLERAVAVAASDHGDQYRDIPGPPEEDGPAEDGRR
jgi:hypothetical protein